MKFSIILLTYESAFDKIKVTLDSVLDQTNDSFEVVICDDGSKSFPKDDIVSYFEEKSFSNYKLVVNEVNKGTIKNCISGIEVATGECVKLIGAGDLLYDEETVNNMYDYLHNSEYGIAFGLMKSFYQEEGKYCFSDSIFAPRLLKPYQERDDKTIKRNLLMCRDYISGASLFGKRDFIEKYLHKMSHIAVYLEDYMTLLVVLDGEKIGYLEEYVVYYELFSGVSTKKGSEGNKRLQKDSENAWNEIIKLYDDKKLRRNVLARQKADKINSKLLRNFYRLFHCPSALYVRNKHSVVKKDKKGFLERK